MSLDRLIVSCCANPEMPLIHTLPDYAGVGYTRYEAFVDWVKSALDYTADPGEYRALAAGHGMTFASLHLPRFTDDEPERSFGEAVQAARFAAGLGMSVVYPRATSMAALVRDGKPFLDAVEGLGLTVAVEIHQGFPVYNVASLLEAFEGVGDSRLKAVLEMGHLHLAGETWRDCWAAAGDRVAVVHLKDIRDGKSVPLGAGEVDLTAMLSHLRSVGFAGEYVVELLLKDQGSPLPHLAAAREFVRPYLEG